MRMIALVGPALAAFTAPAAAYIGPGVGPGAIAAVLGAIALGVLAFGGVLWFPINRMIRRRREKR